MEYSSPTKDDPASEVRQQGRSEQHEEDANVLVKAIVVRQKLQKKNMACELFQKYFNLQELFWWNQFEK